MDLAPLIDDYKQYCRYASECAKNKKLDLSSDTFFFPTTLLPLIVLTHKENIAVLPPDNFSVANYLKTITNGSRFSFAERFNKSYLPLVSLPQQKEDSDRILQRLYQMYNNGRDCGGENAFKYLIGEIADNIYEHSEFSNSLVMAQVYPTKGFMDICFFDDGITIHGCFKKHGMKRRSDCLAIEQAINGASTKDVTRGFGLNTTMKIFTQGIEGQMLIVSGKGAFQLSKRDQQPYDLDRKLKLKGTMVGVRIPYPSSEVNMYEYLQ
jgi:hypothetical protein